MFQFQQADKIARQIQDLVSVWREHTTPNKAQEGLDLRFGQQQRIQHVSKSGEWSRNVFQCPFKLVSNCLDLPDTHSKFN